MNIDYLVKVVTLTLTISVANERLVEIVKGWFDGLSEQKTDPKEERQRQNRLHMIAVVGGLATAALAWQFIASALQSTSNSGTALAVTLIGICASGGIQFLEFDSHLSLESLKSTAADNLQTQAVIDQGMNVAAVAQLKAPLQTIADNAALDQKLRSKARLLVQGMP